MVDRSLATVAVLHDFLVYTVAAFWSISEWGWALLFFIARFPQAKPPIALCTVRITDKERTEPLVADLKNMEEREGTGEGRGRGRELYTSSSLRFRYGTGTSTHRRLSQLTNT